MRNQVDEVMHIGDVTYYENCYDKLPSLIGVSCRSVETNEVSHGVTMLKG